MDIRRRAFLGGAGAIIGSTVSGAGLAQGRPPVTREQWDAQIAGAMDAPNFNCMASPQADEGPFYDPASPRRRDITEGNLGEPLTLRITLGAMAGPTRCRPLVGAVVDIWQANALGQYSNVGENIQQAATPGETFMRGHQIADDTGTVEFATVVPGWEAIAVRPPADFATRTTHIHVKIYHEWQVFDTQLYFPDELITSLYENVEPYRSNTVLTVPGTGQQITRTGNMDDNLFRVMRASPMAMELVDGRLVANATIGMFGVANRGLPSLFGRP